MDETDVEELRDFLDRTEDEELLRQRRILEQGEAQPTPEVFESLPIFDDLIELPIGDSIVLPIEGADIEGLADEIEAGDVWPMLVIRDQGITDNTLSLRIEVGGLEELEAGFEDENVPPVADLYFFDHIDGEMHALGDVVSTDAVLGHWFLDATDSLRSLQAVGLAGELAVRLSTQPVNDDVAPEVAVSVGRMSLDLTTGVERQG